MLALNVCACGFPLAQVKDVRLSPPAYIRYALRNGLARWLFTPLNEVVVTRTAINGTEDAIISLDICVRGVCVCERERDLCVCVCVREREGGLDDL